MLKIYVMQIVLIAGAVGVIGILPETADLLSKEVPQPVYVQTFRPTTLAEDVHRVSLKTVRWNRYDSGEAQTASLDN